MRRPVQRKNRDTTTSACVGWDFSNIENRLAFRKQARLQDFGGSAAQNGFTITRMTMAIINNVGTSLTIRQWRADFSLRSSANLRTAADK